MKKLYAFLIFACTATFTIANPLITSTAADGNWRNSSTCSLGRTPANGDTVVIPAGKIVLIDNIQNLNTDVLYVEVFGTLKFNNGKLWLNDNSSVAIFSGGSIISTGSSSETLRIGGIDKFSGGLDGALSLPGIANKLTGASPLGFNTSGNVILPLKFTSFNVARQENGILVQWSAIAEGNGNYYEVQRSENGNDWKTVTSLTLPGNTADHAYSYLDKNVSARVSYYRVRLVDINRTYVYSPVGMIKNETDLPQIKVTSCSSNAVSIFFSEQLKVNVAVRLTSASGQLAYQKAFPEPVGQLVIPVQGAIKGIYILTITDGHDLKISKQILL